MLGKGQTYQPYKNAMVSDPKKWQELLNDLTTIGLLVRLCLCTEIIPTCGSVWLRICGQIVTDGDLWGILMLGLSLSFAEMRK